MLKENRARRNANQKTLFMTPESHTLLFVLKKEFQSQKRGPGGMLREK
jgi:hypothetical protein